MKQKHYHQYLLLLDNEKEQVVENCQVIQHSLSMM